MTPATPNEHPTPNEHRALLGALSDQRSHIFDTLHGLDADELRRRMLPSGWTCLGLVNHLSIDVERFWFQAVIAGDRGAGEGGSAPASNAWDVGIDVSPESVLDGYRHNIERADAIIATSSLDAAPAWWPQSLFGSWRLDSVREIVLHVVTETAAHVGHLDVVRELIDGRQRLAITD